MAIHMKIPFHLDHIFLQGLQPIEISQKFTFSAVPYKNSTNIDIFTDTSKNQVKITNECCKMLYTNAQWICYIMC